MNRLTKEERARLDAYVQELGAEIRPRSSTTDSMWAERASRVVGARVTKGAFQAARERCLGGPRHAKARCTCCGQAAGPGRPLVDGRHAECAKFCSPRQDPPAASSAPPPAEPGQAPTPDGAEEAAKRPVHPRVLVKCPHCDSSVVETRASLGAWWVACHKCGLTGPNGDSEADAIDAWNTTMALTAVVRLDELVERVIAKMNFNPVADALLLIATDIHWFRQRLSDDRLIRRLFAMADRAGGKRNGDSKASEQPELPVGDRA